MEKSYRDFKAAIQILETSLKAYRDNKEMYRVVANQLEILLCDRDALIPRLFPDVRFHRLFVKPRSKMDTRNKIGKNRYKLTFNFVLPGLIDARQNRIKVLTIFDETKKPIKFKSWINQPLFSKDFTLRDFVKLVRNIEGAHSVPEAPKKFKITKKFFIENDDIARTYITKIGEYVLTQCKLLDTNYRKQG